MTHVTDMSEEWNRPEVSRDPSARGPSANQINRELGNSINLGSDTKLVRLRIQTPITNFGQEKVFMNSGWKEITSFRKFRICDDSKSSDWSYSWEFMRFSSNIDELE